MGEVGERMGEVGERMGEVGERSGSGRGEVGELFFLTKRAHR